MSRKKNSILNASSGIIVYFIKTILSFITRTVFIYILGKEYLGLDSLILNTVMMLSIAELGISSAISFSLYEPLAKNNLEKVSTIMSLYKKAYFLVGTFILIAGVVLSIFLPSFISDISNFENVYLIFYLYLVNTALSYFISYKDILLSADQKTYKITKYSLASSIILSASQIIILLFTKNYILYLIMNLIVNLGYRSIVNRHIGRNYLGVSFNSKNSVEKVEKKSIIKNVKALFFHKIGGYIVNGTDSLIIAKFVGIGAVGMYANYLMIVTVASSLISQTFNSLIPSFGNLLTMKDNNKSYHIFEQMNILNFVLSGLASLLIAICINDFILLWIGPKYILSSVTVILITISFFLTTMRISSFIAKSAAGLFDVDKYTPIIQSIVNLVFSLLLVGPLGLNGIILGTIISSILLPSWQRPYIVYKFIFKRSSKVYFLNYFKDTILLITCYLALMMIGHEIELMFNSMFVVLMLKAVVTVIGFASLSVLIHHKNMLFMDAIRVLTKIPKKLLRRNNK